MFVMWPDLSERLTGIKRDEECEGDTRGEETQAEQQQVGHLLSVHADKDTELYKSPLTANISHEYTDILMYIDEKIYIWISNV